MVDTFVVFLTLTHAPKFPLPSKPAHYREFDFPNQPRLSLI